MSALQPADLAQRGGVEVLGEVADGLVVVVGEGVEAGAVEGGVEGLGGGTREAAVSGVSALAGPVSGLPGAGGDVLLLVVLTAQRVHESPGFGRRSVCLGKPSGPPCAAMPVEIVNQARPAGQAANDISQRPAGPAAGLVVSMLPAQAGS
ncbi:hypothetical protein AB0A71_04970 [Kitasatospora aureofaciens]|uniref:hypothetical protein n=1 Tax=Kitasatospora aureofaciens TaxID=1894 RepID=UPI0034077BA4